jgi:hypothetical protein
MKNFSTFLCFEKFSFTIKECFVRGFAGIAEISSKRPLTTRLLLQLILMLGSYAAPIHANEESWTPPNPATKTSCDGFNSLPVGPVANLSFCRQFPGSSKCFNFTVYDPSKHKLKIDGTEDNIKDMQSVELPSTWRFFSYSLQKEWQSDSVGEAARCLAFLASILLLAPSNVPRIPPKKQPATENLETWFIIETHSRLLCCVEIHFFIREIEIWA